MIYCNDEKCLHYRELEKKKIVDFSKGQSHFSNDGFTGVCSKEEIALEPKTIDTINVHHYLVICKSRSDKHISGHLDFSRFPQGGNIPDPVEY